MKEKKGLLIVGHGSRSQEARDTFEETVQLVRRTGEYSLVEGAHMELAQPSIPEMVEKLAAEQVDEIIVVPYFLYKGIHIKKDIPQIMKELSNKYPRINFKLGEPIGAEPIFTRILLNRAREALDFRSVKVRGQ